MKLWGMVLEMLLEVARKFYALLLFPLFDAISSPKVISSPNTISKYDYKYSEYSSLVEKGKKYNSKKI